MPIASFSYFAKKEVLNGTLCDGVDASDLSRFTHLSTFLILLRVREGSERAQRASESIGRYKPTGLRWGSKAACFVLI